MIVTGRVMSYHTMAFVGMAPFGSLVAGSVAARIGAPDTVGAPEVQVKRRFWRRPAEKRGRSGVQLSSGVAFRNIFG